MQSGEHQVSEILKTGIRNSRNVKHYTYGRGCVADLKSILASHRQRTCNNVIFFIDGFFERHGIPEDMDAILPGDQIIYLDTAEEPTTTYINDLYSIILASGEERHCAVVGMGGGISMDIAKAVSNLLTNGGKAEDYQGWDLVQAPGIFKVGVPTLSGTGAESTRTCVMTNPVSGLKLGMNSDHTVFDQIILDPNLTATVPRNQYFYTGMDAYIHCLESLQGSYRNAVGDAFAEETIKLCRSVFYSKDMMGIENREKMMVASYLGGCAIANSYVGVVHPFSAGLSVVLKLHHGIANCIAMRAMEEFYPEGFKEFWEMVGCQDVEIPQGVCGNLTDEQYDALYRSTVVHEKPLTNALGENFRKMLSKESVIEIFKRM